MDTKTVNISVEHSKDGYVTIKEEDWDTLLYILTEQGAEVHCSNETGILDYFKSIYDE
jgi:hypothetical protein